MLGLGLGDTNYTRFCQAAITMDNKLRDVGATRICDICKADEVTGMEEIEPWLAKFWPAIESFRVFLCFLIHVWAAPLSCKCKCKLPQHMASVAQVWHSVAQHK